MRSLLAAILLLAPAFTGCLDSGIVEELRNDLEAEDEHEERVLLSEEVRFTPADVLDPDRSYEDESDLSARWNETFTVPEGTRSVTSTFEIVLGMPDEPDGSPVNPPDGEVRVYIETSDGDERTLTRTEPASAGFDFPSPPSGEWTIGMEARGNGTVTFHVDAIVPVDAPE